MAKIEHKHLNNGNLRNMMGDYLLRISLTFVNYCTCCCRVDCMS